MTPAPVAVNGSLRRLADALPEGRRFLVVAAEETSGLHRIEEQLQTMAIPSAWQSLPGLYVGVVAIRPDSVDRVIGLLNRTTLGRIGVSPPYADADQLDLGLKLARIALAAATVAEPVKLFDRAPLNMVALADVEVARTVVHLVFGNLDDLAADDRDVLLATLAAWSTHDGSAGETAAALYCHPNTVRYRLHRVEERTGRSLTNPRDVAELVFALQARALLGLDS